MSYHCKLLLSVSVLMLQSGCASVGGQNAASAEPQHGGIRTRAIGAAPATQPANNPSRPLSQQNTPTAAAAREAAAHSESESLTANPELAAVSATAARPTPAVPPQSKALQKGDKVQVKSGTALYGQPNKASQTVAVAQDAELVLGPQIYNVGGYWWYVTAGKESGWLLQTDIAR